VWKATGEYKEVVRPSRLAYSWRWEDDEAWDGVESIVSVMFTETAEGTEIALSHRGFPSEESRGNHEHGWNSGLDKLAKLVSKPD
jgi:uncharacterized protein YndB with AHSA1/START domain